MFAKYLNVKIEIKLDKTKPNGMPRKVMDVSMAKKNMGGMPKCLLNQQ